MRCFRRWSRTFISLLVITIFTFFIFFIISIGYSDNEEVYSKYSHHNIITSASLIPNAPSLRHYSYPFQPLYYLRRNYSDFGERRSNVGDHQLLHITDFEFLMNSSHICESRARPFLVAFVHSSPVNFKKRSIIRRTWASIDHVNGLAVNVVFIIGLLNDSRLQHQLDEEYLLYGDLVQGKFNDSYHNLTYKHLSGYKWVLNYCNSTRFVMKADDDAFIDIFRIVKVLKETFDNNNNDPNHSQRDILACSVFPDGTTPMRHGKWSLTLQQYPYQTYPRYCSGVAYFSTIDVIYDLLEGAHQINPVLRIDDLFLTGIVAAALKLRHLPLNLRYVYDVNRLREWLHNDQSRPCSYMIGDIGDVPDWDSLMIKLWMKTVKVWNQNDINSNAS